MVALFVALWALAPFLLPIALAVDVLRRLARGIPFTTTRLLGFALFYTASEMVGMAALALGPVLAHDGEALLEQTYRVQAAWAGALLAAARSLFGLTFEVEGLEALTPGPLVIFMRHASIVDTLLPTVLLARPTRMRLRFVLKRELLALPCLDIAGLRLPNCFVARGGEGSEGEIARVRALAEGMGERDGVLIYPEGTRFSEAKRDKALERLRERDPSRFARVAGLRHLLPTRPGGPVALLDAGTDVVTVAHAGLEAFAELVDVWRGRMVGRRVVISLRRWPKNAIPEGLEQRLAWLDERWGEMDAWIEAREPGPRE
jgi:1-acyl-sn-glycerol-3-phosphate acyltransferase